MIQEPHQDLTNILWTSWEPHQSRTQKTGHVKLTSVPLQYTSALCNMQKPPLNHLHENYSCQIHSHRCDSFFLPSFLPSSLLLGWVPLVGRVVTFNLETSNNYALLANLAIGDSLSLLFWVKRGAWASVRSYFLLISVALLGTLSCPPITWPGSGGSPCTWDLMPSI